MRAEVIAVYDLKDDEYLSPTDFTMEGRLEALSFRVTSNTEEPTPTQPLKRWAHVHNLLGHFLKRWTNEYITSLQQRNKWALETPHFKKTGLVYVADDNAPVSCGL